MNCVDFYEIRPENCPRQPGVYLVLLSLPQGKRIKVGALGEFFFAPGYYLYVGSAMGGLYRRIGRYFRNTGKIRWHLDYLLKEACLEKILVYPTETRMECVVSDRIASRLERPVNGFGSSDCRCPSHLFYAPLSVDPLVEVIWFGEKKYREDASSK